MAGRGMMHPQISARQFYEQAGQPRASCTRREPMAAGASSLRQLGWWAGRLSALSVVALCALPSCGSELRRAQLGSHPVTGSDPDIVDFPPPPAEVEEIPPDPGPPCVWVDGRWEYVGRRWEWQAGAWVNPRAECYYATPVMVWLPSAATGELYYLQGRWYTAAGEPCGEPKLCRVRESAEVPRSGLR